LREAWPLLQEDYAPIITVSTSNFSEKRAQDTQNDRGQDHSQEQDKGLSSALEKALKQAKKDFVVPRELADFAQQADGTTQALSSFRGQKVQALAGIGKPEVFFNMLRTQGISLSKTQALSDHDNMRALQIDPQMGAVLCTEKDAVKLWNFHPRAWAVPLVTELPEELLNTILALISPKL
jgi:tetraacyldisaccharide-1-P 4'-kinase